MDTYKAIEILSKLTTKEFKSLEEYLVLKSTKCRPQVLHVFNLLQKRKRDLPITKGQLSKYSKLPQRRLDDLMNKMLYPILEFCTLESMKQRITDLDKTHYLMEFFSERGLTDNYDSLYEETSAKLASASPISPAENLSFYKYYKGASIHEKIIKGRKLRLQFSEFVPYLDAFYLTEKLKLICESINRKTLLNTKELEDIAVVLEIAKGQSNASLEFMNIYLNIANLLLKRENITVNNYDLLYRQIDALAITTFSYEEVLTLHHYLINFALDGLRNDSAAFMPKFRNLITQMESKGLLLEEGLISAPIFKISISVGLKGKYTQWVDAFFAKYSNLVAGSNNEEVIDFCEALILYSKKKYKEAARKLKTIKSSAMDVHFNMDIRKLELKICIEENLQNGKEFNDCVNISKNMRDFIHSKDGIGLEIKDRTLRFISYAGKISSVYSVPEEKQKLLKKIQEEKEIADKEWLLSVLNDKGRG